MGRESRMRIGRAGTGMAAGCLVLAASCLAGCGASGGPAASGATSSDPASSPAQGASAAAGTLPAGKGSVSIESTWTLSASGAMTGQVIRGTIDGLALVAKAALPAGEPVYYCNGFPGTVVSGTLGGVAFSVSLQCGPQAGVPSVSGDYVQAYQGEWGGRAIRGTGEMNELTFEPVIISGTVGTQHISATVKTVSGSSPDNPGGPANVPNRVTGSIVVS